MLPVLLMSISEARRNFELPGDLRPASQAASSVAAHRHGRSGSTGHGGGGGTRRRSRGGAVTSPPLVPRATRPVRIALCAMSMWTIWVRAYLVTLSNDDWYRAYDHATAGGLRPAIDQQI